MDLFFNAEILTCSPPPHELKVTTMKERKKEGRKKERKKEGGKEGRKERGKEGMQFYIHAEILTCCVPNIHPSPPPPPPPPKRTIFKQVFLKLGLGFSSLDAPGSSLSFACNS